MFACLFNTQDKIIPFRKINTELFVYSNDSSYLCRNREKVIETHGKRDSKAN